MKSKIIKQICKPIFFLPLLLYFGPRSYIAYDEGFYSLQAKWILQNNNWIIPVWWDQYVLDRTIGIQFLIAKSQQIFGESSFAAHLPSTAAAGLMLFLTYKLHQELISKKDAIFSTLILATTYIWLDFAHLATQDMVFACLVTSGIYSLTKLRQERHFIYLIVFGSWIGLAFMMKTFLVAIPLVTLLPYAVYKKQIINNKFFLLSLISGFLPFFIWTFFMNQYLDKNIIFFLLEKFNTLSTKNGSTNPFYYYLWNIPINFLPWSIFSITGLIYQFKTNNKINYFLFYFPIIFIIILSLFSTKTPYYALPISSILSLNAYLGFKSLLKIKELQNLLVNFTSKFIPFLIFLVIAIYFFILRRSIGFNLKEELFLIIGLLLTSILFLTITINRKKGAKAFFLTFIFASYLISFSFVQSGLLTDRSRNLRETIEYVVARESLRNTSINVIYPQSIDDNSMSKLIKISLLTPSLGKAIKDIKDLKYLEFAWIIEPESFDISRDKYEIISSDQNLYPWKLIKKKI